MRSDELPFKHPWAEGPVSEYADVIVGGTPSTEIASFWGGEVRWMVSGDVHQRTVRDVAGRITDKGLGFSNATLVSPEAVAIALAGQGKTRGTAALTVVPLCTNQSVALIKPKDQRLSARFLFQSLLPRYEELRSRSSGGGRAGLTKALLESLPIQVPKPYEQERITRVLETVDQAIRTTEALIAKTLKIKAGLMHELFTRGVLPDGTLRPTNEEAPHLYKESAGGTVPRDWEVARLASKCRYNRAHLKTGPFGSSLKLEHWVEVGHPVITIGSLGEGEFIHSELLFVGPATVLRMREYQLQPGDIVFSRVADVGRSAVIREEQAGWIMSGNMMRISLDPEQVVPDYLQAQLAYNQNVRRQIRRSVNAGGREVANSAILNRLWFAWPGREEQVQVMQRVSSLEATVRQETRHADKLGIIKQGLMRDLLTGTIDMSRLEGAAVGV